MRFSRPRLRAHLNAASAIAAGANPADAARFEETKIAEDQRLAEDLQRDVSVAIQSTIARLFWDHQIAWCLAYDARKGRGGGGGNDSNKKHSESMRRKVAAYDMRNRRGG